MMVHEEHKQTIIIYMHGINICFLFSPFSFFFDFSVSSVFLPRSCAVILSSSLGDCPEIFTESNLQIKNCFEEVLKKCFE